MNTDELTFITTFNFKDNLSKKKFIDFAESENGIIITKNYKGCLYFDLFDSKNDENRIIIIQKWDSMENKKKYLKMRKEEGTYKFFESLVKSPIELDLLTPINLNSKL